MCRFVAFIISWLLLFLYVCAFSFILCVVDLKSALELISIDFHVCTELSISPRLKK